MDSQVDISICIGTRNTKDFLRKFLKSIYKFTRGVSFEIFVVDSNSSDGTFEMIREEFKKVKYLQNDGTKGFAYSINQCLSNMAGRYAVVLTSDTYLTEDAFFKLTIFMDQNPKIGICQPKILNPDLSIQDIGRKAFSFFDHLKLILHIFKWESLIKGRDPNKASEVHVVSGACMFIRQKVIKDIGFLDENFFIYNEEDDYCIRARERRWKVFYYPNAEIIHAIGKSTSKEPSAFLNIISYWSQFSLIRKHFNIFEFYILLIVSKLIILFKMSLYLLKLLYNKPQKRLIDAIWVEWTKLRIIKLSRSNLNIILETFL